MAKTLAKMTAGIAALLTATWLGTTSSRAYPHGYAPWCAVIPLSGDVYWDCQYRTVEECVPNVLAGNRGFCNLNPWPAPFKKDRAKELGHRLAQRGDGLCWTCGRLLGLLSR